MARKCVGHHPGDEPTLTRCHSYMKSLKGGSVLWPSPQLKGIKGKILFFCLLALLIFYFHSFHGMMHADPTVVGSG